MNDLKTLIGSRIKFLRELRNLSQEDFAKSLGIDISRGHISRIEAGRNMPSAEFIKSVADIYNISADWILTGRGKGPEENQTHPEPYISQEIDVVDFRGIFLSNIDDLKEYIIQRASRIGRAGNDLKKEDNIIYLAEIFGEFLDERIARASPPGTVNKDLTEKEAELIRLYRQLSDEDKYKIEGIVEFLVSEDPF